MEEKAILVYVKNLISLLAILTERGSVPCPTHQFNPAQMLHPKIN